MLLEPDIKAIVLNHLRNKGVISVNSTIINEFTLHNDDRRVDLAVYEKDRFFAIEIKSEADSLYRLKGQVDRYDELFDKVIVVSAPKHTQTILETLPTRIAVWEVSASKITIKRRGRISVVTNKESLSKLLLKNDWDKLVRALNQRAEGEVLLPDSLSIKELRVMVRSSIRSRFSNSSSHFWEVTNRRIINPEDLPLLSRFLIERGILKSNRQSRELFWEKWSKSTFEDDLQTYHSRTYQVPSNFGKVPEEILELLEA